MSIVIAVSTVGDKVAVIGILEVVINANGDVVVIIKGLSNNTVTGVTVDFSCKLPVFLGTTFELVGLFSTEILSYSPWSFSLDNNCVVVTDLVLLFFFFDFLVVLPVLVVTCLVVDDSRSVELISYSSVVVVFLDFTFVDLGAILVELSIEYVVFDVKVVDVPEVLLVLLLAVISGKFEVKYFGVFDPTG